MLLAPVAALAIALSPSSVRSEAQDPPAGTRRTIECRPLTMGATFSVEVVTTQDDVEGVGLNELDRVIRAKLDRINRLMSTWDPDSELSRVNRSASLEPLPISRELRCIPMGYHGENARCFFRRPMSIDATRPFAIVLRTTAA